MNLLSNTATMSSREIAELTGKQISHVHRDFKTMMNDLGVTDNGVLTTSGASSKYGSAFDYELDAQGRIALINLNQELTLTLVSGYSAKLRNSIIKRWKELEANQENQLSLPQSFAEALRLAADQAEQLAIAAPKVAFVDELVNRDNLMTATQVGQKHKMSAIKLNRFLDELGGVYSKRVERGRVFLQPFINKGYGELKQNNTGHDQPLFTNKGEIWINEQLAAKGVE